MASNSDSLEATEAIRAFRDKEVAAGRWSAALPHSYSKIPGTRLSPMFVTWQKGKARVITDHKASGLNDGIPSADAHVLYDDMRSFGQALLQAKLKHPGRQVILWKSDVAKAFLNLPVHPIWQLRQMVTVDELVHIIWRLVFGNRGSPKIWCAVSGLICWISVVRLELEGTEVYMDDYFGWDFSDNLITFHNAQRPRKQVQLLILWEHIGCPYDDKKQLSGCPLPIIGFWVDSIYGSISLPPTSITLMCEEISTFLSYPGRQPPLSMWQHLAGYLNWSLNVIPWARPALSGMYKKMGGKVLSRAGVFLNAEVVEELTWFRDVLRSENCRGVRLIEATSWSDEEADVIVWTDASMMGLAYVFGNSGFVYQHNANSSSEQPRVDIFFLEMVAIMAAIHALASKPHPPARILLYTDSLDSVAVLDSLSAAQPMHNAVLMALAKILIFSNIDLRVRHIPGSTNLRADLLSRLLLDDFTRQFPSQSVRLFSPPRDLLPTRWRTSF